MIVRFVVILLVLFGLTIGGKGLIRHFGYADLEALATQIRNGRFEPTDLERIRPLTGLVISDRFACSGRAALHEVMRYRANMIGVLSGKPALRDMTDPFVVAAKILSRQTARHALACAPLDGGLWLDLAIADYALHAKEDSVSYSLSISRKRAPLESRVVALREFIFPILDPKHYVGPL